jgi:3-oxoacyl-[acyl-carrier-protein] synthase-3
MSFQYQYRTRIAGTGSYLPEKLLTNKDLEKIIDTTDEWIRERTGIETRHIAAPDQATSDLTVIAAKEAIKDAGLEPKDIDCIICATITPDYIMPSTACLIQTKLGLSGIPAFDLAAACSGFLYSMQLADQLIKNGIYKNILCCGAEVLHRYLNYKDRESCILFGDGAGAFVLQRTAADNPNVIKSTHLHAEGSLYDLLMMPAGGSKTPITKALAEEPEASLRMKGREIFKNAVRAMSQSCHEALEYNQIKMDEIDWMVPHQANWRIMEAVADHFKFPKDKVISIVKEMGNTSAATIPVAFDFARKRGFIKRDQTILLTAFGAGLTSGSAVLKF